MPFFKTLRHGERALLVNRRGAASTADGPQRVIVVGKSFQKLDRVTADQKEYIRVQYRNGNIDHLPGPTFVFMNPLRMESARKYSAISLDANEVLVVYQRERESGGVLRRIQYGPTVFTPSADEWIHQFVWHGTDPNNKTRKIPGALKFSQLRVIPDQFYLNIDDVRTKDDALITVKMMVFFELREIEKMLNQTADPIADFINAMQADVVAFASQLSYEEFMENSSKLNSLQHYPQLVSLSERIGYVISKVVFRGYHTSDQLQRLHDQAVEKRSALKTQMESEQQTQDLTDSKLLNKQQRQILEESLSVDKLKHKHTLEKEQLIHKLKLEAKEYEEMLERDKAKQLADLASKKKLQDEQLAHLKQLKELGVDITTYLVSQHPKPDNVLRVITKGEGSSVHIHP